MTQRAIIITLCICITGASVVPASWLPCCCKAKQVKSHEEASRTSCPSCNVPEDKPDGVEMHLYCCTRDDPKFESGVVTPACPNCRCHEQMRLVGLSPAADGESGLRYNTVSASFSFFDAAIDDVGCNFPKICEVLHRPSMDKSLKTCSFRF